MIIQTNYCYYVLRKEKKKNLTHLLEDLDSSIDVTTRSAADTVEGPGGREDVIVVALAASLIESLDKDSSAVKRILLLKTLRIAVAVTTAGTLARISRTSLETFAVALARFVASGADVSAHKTLRNSSFSSSLNDLVDLGTESTLTEDSSLVTLETSKGKRNIILRNIDSLLLHKLVAGLTKSVSDTSGGNTEELLHGKLLNISITILARLSRVLSELPSISKEGVKSDNRGILLIHRTDPATRPAGSDEGAKSVIVPASISRIISRSRGGDVNIIRNILLVEHGTRIASLDKDDILVVKVLRAEHGEPVLNILATSETTTIRHSNDISVTVIIIIEENIILSGGLKSLATARARSHASKDSDKVISGGVLTSVIVGDTRVNVDVISALDVEIVENLTRERILRRLSNIISHEDDDTFIRNTKLMSNLISMTNRSLMSVVAIRSRTSNKNNPSMLGISSSILFSKSLL